MENGDDKPVGPQTISALTCDGCAHLVIFNWKMRPKNWVSYDAASCKAGKHEISIDNKWDNSMATPEWCPHLPTEG